MDVPTLRAVLPAFADPSLYTDTMITYWLQKASNALDQMAWGNRLDEGLLYYTAHALIMAKRAERLATGSAQGSGIIASKSVGPASISYDNSIGMNAGAGSYNLTPFGTRFWELAQLVGMGGLQLNPAIDGFGLPGIYPTGRIVL